MGLKPVFKNPCLQKKRVSKHIHLQRVSFLASNTLIVKRFYSSFLLLQVVTMMIRLMLSAKPWKSRTTIRPVANQMTTRRTTEVVDTIYLMGKRCFCNATKLQQCSRKWRPNMTSSKTDKSAKAWRERIATSSGIRSLRVKSAFVDSNVTSF